MILLSFIASTSYPQQIIIKNPPLQQLCYGEKYLCFIGNECIGMATYVDDPYIGESFSRLVVHKRRGLEEEFLVPEWALPLQSDC